MPITDGDVKLYQSEAMHQEDDGGGRMSGVVIPDGSSNLVFEDVSELQRAYGDVDISKLFLAVQTADNARYYGAMMTIDRQFLDPKVSGLLFSTGDHADRRSDIRDHIESYVVAGPITVYHLWDRQIEGQRAILLFTRVGVLPPEIGDVYYLVGNDGLPTEYGQYVRITSVEVQSQTFTDINGDYQRDIITAEISAPLRHTFDGAEMSRLDEWDTEAQIRSTLVADAAKYYGCEVLQSAASIGAIELALGSVYGQLVPSSRGESPVADVQAGGTVAQTINSGGTDFEVAGPAHTQVKEVTLANRAYTYVFNLQPIPARGTATVDYRALGRWYRLTEQGDGTFSGPGGGAGVLNFDTGTLSITLGALPDIGSVVIPTWGSPIHYVDRAGTAEVEKPAVVHDLGHPATPGSVSFSWLEATVTKNATAAVDGTISGDGATGRVVHATGRFWIEFTTLPDAGSQIQVDYSEDNSHTEVFSGLSKTGGHVALTLANTPIKPGSLVCEFEVRASQVYSRASPCMEDGYASGMIWIPGCSGATRPSPDRQEMAVQSMDDGAAHLGENGTVTYATGAVDLEVDVAFSGNHYESSADPEWVVASQESLFVTGIVTARYVQDTGTPTVRQALIDIPSPEVRLLPLTSDYLIPGTVRFTFGGTAFSDRAGQGVLYWDDDTIAGSVDYHARTLTLDQHTGGSAVTITSLVSAYGDWFDYDYTYRTPGSPLQPASLIQNATTLAGDLLSETADLGGVIDSATAEGTVEQSMGFVQIRFGSLELDSSLTPEQKAEPWYDPADIDGDGKIWVPLFVFPNTVRASMVVYTFLPLDAEVLGLDPVRLPSDGRVPIVRPGDLLIPHHEATIDVPSPTLGQVIDCGRERLARVRVLDDDDTELTGGGTDYTADLDAGTVTLGDVSGYTAPLHVIHRVEDVKMVSDAQIDGTITLTQPITHDYPADETLCSSVLIVNTLFARVLPPFEQQTWTGDWSDTLIGDAPTASYNTIQYPITTDNTGAIKERWALIFDNATTGRVVGETVGQIAVFDTAVDLAPMNTLTGRAYFTVLAAGWGAGWSGGNVLRFNTEAAAYPVDAARCIEQGEAAVTDDVLYLAVRGDKDAP